MCILLTNGARVSHPPLYIYYTCVFDDDEVVIITTTTTAATTYITMGSGVFTHAPCAREPRMFCACVVFARRSCELCDVWCSARVQVEYSDRLLLRGGDML